VRYVYCFPSESEFDHLEDFSSNFVWFEELGVNMLFWKNLSFLDKKGK
jgi:hypothetical protein